MVKEKAICNEQCGECYLRAVWRPSWKDIFCPIPGQLPEAGSIHIDDVEFGGSRHIVRKHDSTAVRRIVRAPKKEIGRWQIGDLEQVRPVRIHRVQLPCTRELRR